MSAEPIYLDHHATTRVDPRVLEAMAPFWTMQPGNPSSPHHLPARRAADAIDAARAQVARLLHVEPREIVFTSGATEANNLAILGALRAAPPGSHLVISAVEHPSVLEPAAQLRREGFAVTAVPVNADGRVEPAAVAAAVNERTVLVSVMAANNEIGTIQPIDDIAAWCRQRGVLFHTDAVQAVPCLPLPLDAWPVDLLSLSSHKLYGPAGIGALVVRRRTPRVPLQPLMYGGGQEQRRRPGTLPTSLIVGFGQACELVAELMASESQRVADLRDRLWNRLQSRVDGLALNGGMERRLPGNLHFSVDGVDGDALLASLTAVAVSSGAACSASDHKLSHVLQAIGTPEQQIRSSLRIGVGRFNTETEMDRAADHMADVIFRLRAAPFRRGATPRA